MKQWFIDPNTIYTPFVTAWEKINLRPDHGKSLNEVYRRMAQLSRKKTVCDVLSLVIMVVTLFFGLGVCVASGQVGAKVVLIRVLPILVCGMVTYLVVDKKGINAAKENSVLINTMNTFSHDITALAGDPEDDEAFRFLDEKQVMANLVQKAGMVSVAQSKFLEAKNDPKVESWRLKATIETGMKEERELTKMIEALKPFGITPPDRRLLFSQAPPIRIVLKK